MILLSLTITFTLQQSTVMVIKYLAASVERLSEGAGGCTRSLSARSKLMWLYEMSNVVLAGTHNMHNFCN